MKTFYYLFFSLTFLMLSSCPGTKNKREDLGKLKNIPINSNYTYCVYKVTDTMELPSGQGFKIGDTLCIRCCTTGTNTWPDRGGICPDSIAFEASFGAKYEAGKLSNTCRSCPAGISSSYDCP